MTDNITVALKTDLAFANGDYVLAQDGDLGTVSGLTNLWLALMHRLITVPGSLVESPNYGVGVLFYENASTSFAVQQKLAQLIIDQFEQDARVQEVSSVSISAPDGTPESTRIQVLVTPIGYTELPMVFTPFSGGIS